jgi:hypothetical protein
VCCTVVSVVFVLTICYFFLHWLVSVTQFTQPTLASSTASTRLKMLWWFLFDAFFFFPGLIACYPYTINEFNVGAFFNLNNYDGTMDLSGVQAKEAILMAIREINNKSDGLYDDLLPNITFKLATEHPNILFSTSTVAANAIRTSFNGDGIRGCIGPGTNAAIAGDNLLTCSFCSHPSLSSLPMNAL